MTAPDDTVQHVPPVPVERLAVSVVEAGRLLGIGRTSAYAAVRTGTLPTIRIGGRVLVPMAELRRLLQVDR